MQHDNFDPNNKSESGDTIIENENKSLPEEQIETEDYEEAEFDVEGENTTDDDLDF